MLPLFSRQLLLPSARLLSHQLVILVQSSQRLILIPILVVWCAAVVTALQRYLMTMTSTDPASTSTQPVVVSITVVQQLIRYVPCMISIGLFMVM